VLGRWPTQPVHSPDGNDVALVQPGQGVNTWTGGQPSTGTPEVSSVLMLPESAPVLVALALVVERRRRTTT
jgi:hypothetical protein